MLSASSLPVGSPAPGCPTPVVYPLGHNLYVNITSRCHNRCAMCWKFHPGEFHDLGLLYADASVEPSVNRVVAALEAWPGKYRDLVFCGLGEPLSRPDETLEVARRVRRLGHSIRINTDGQAYLYAGRDILQRLADVVDALSVSLNAPDAETYNRICRPLDPARAFDSILEFLRDAPRYVPDVTATAVRMGSVDLDACARLAESLGVRFRVRAFDPPPIGVR
ncbi:MAG: radical SAM protein [Candidatus Riflebacteria bacterium]|nr:radical SAM protein [Candidatus Riflebacteria bacterium]